MEERKAAEWGENVDDDGDDGDGTVSSQQKSCLVSILAQKLSFHLTLKSAAPLSFTDVRVHKPSLRYSSLHPQGGASDALSPGLPEHAGPHLPPLTYFWHFSAVSCRTHLSFSILTLHLQKKPKRCCTPQLVSLGGATAIHLPPSHPSPSSSPSLHS